MAVQYGEDVFNVLIKAVRLDVNYFRAKCQDAESVLEVGTIGPQGRDLRVYTIPPFNSEVILRLSDDCIFFEKSIRPNPRADARQESGRFFIKTNYDHDMWLEHKGERLDYGAASEILLRDLFTSTLALG